MTFKKHLMAVSLLLTLLTNFYDLASLHLGMVRPYLMDSSCQFLHARIVLSISNLA